MANKTYKDILPALVTVIAGANAALTDRVHDSERFSEETVEYVDLLASLDEAAGGSGEPIGVVLNWAGWEAVDSGKFSALVTERFTGEILYPYRAKVSTLAGDKSTWDIFREMVLDVRTALFDSANYNLGFSGNSGVILKLVQANVADMVVTDFGNEGSGARLVHYLPFTVGVEVDYSRC